MPELPEAQTIARQLDLALTGRYFGNAVVTRKDIVRGDHPELTRVLPGRRVDRVWRRAKRVVIDLDAGLRLIVRLGMSGRLGVEPTDAPLEKHTHVRIAMDRSGWELRFVDPRRFGGIACVTRDGRNDRAEWDRVGIEPLDATVGEFRAALNRRRQIKALLMDQSVVAGLGNIYCDESLHKAGVHPLTIADRLNSKTLERLIRAIRATLRRAIRFNGSTLSDYRDAQGREGSFQRLHKVYQREGGPCRGCGTAIRRIQAAGRSTFFCPSCQPRRPKTVGRRTK